MQLPSQIPWGSIAPQALIGYLIGSIPFGYVFGRLNGIDIRQHGSGNIGATNVFRVLGKKWGIVTFILDFAKAPAAALLIVRFLHGVDAPIIAVLSTVIGHNYPIWLKFKGGKGIATSAGGLLMLMPQAFGILVLVWFAAFLILRFVSLASILAAVSLPFSVAWFYPKDYLLLVLSTFLSILAIWRHRSNIQRLMAGTEHRWTRKKKPAGETS